MKDLPKADTIAETPLVETVTIELSKPVQYPGHDTMERITIKSFTGKDLVECGMPFRAERQKDGSVVEHTIPSACALLLARMALVPPSMVMQMSAYDFNNAASCLKIFFYTGSLPRLPNTTSS